MFITLSHIVVLGGVIVVVALGTKLKTVEIHGNNPLEVSHTAQQGKPIKMKEQMLKGQMPRSKCG